MIDGYMTVGDLARRTGMSAKSVRRFTDLGLIYSRGRSAANYRLYDETALWCVHVIATLRGLGLTVDEIKALGSLYLDSPEADVRSMFEDSLRVARRRLESKINRLAETRARQLQVLAKSGSLAEMTGPDPTRS